MDRPPGSRRQLWWPMNPPMGIQRIAPQPEKEPRAICPSCRRPVVVLKTGKCSYCGAPLPGAVPVVASARGLPPEVLVSLEPRTAVVSSRSKWIRRMLAVGVTFLLVAAVMGSCMKS